MEITNAKSSRSHFGKPAAGQRLARREPLECKCLWGANQSSNIRLMKANRHGGSPDAQVDHFYKH